MWQALRRIWPLVGWAAFFGVFANLLMLTGPLYMLQVYDRVLSSGSKETLVALSLLMLVLFVAMGVLDYCRALLLSRAGRFIESQLSRRLFDAVLRKAAVLPDRQTDSALRDLENVGGFIASPLLIALFDLPWAPFFVAVIFAFHPYLGGLAVLGALSLLAMTVLNQVFTRKADRAAEALSQTAQHTAEQFRGQAGTLRALGMQQAAIARWDALRADAALRERPATSRRIGFTTATKTLRLFLQSAMLGLGAWLVIGGQMTPGGILAGSVLLGRALSPVETAIAQWPIAQHGLRGYRTLKQLLAEVPPDKTLLELPRPKAALSVTNLSIRPPGQREVTLKALSFDVRPGQAVGVIGPSGAGKSTLAHALTGLWPAAGGDIRLDGATLEQFPPEVRGALIGYLPQQMQFFDGTLAENIARLERNPDDAAVVAAAQLAGAHDMILRLPRGYDTPMGADRTPLSGGQLQRIGLARALYRAPEVVIMDEPNANLDAAGSEALNTAIRALKARGCAVLIMAHRPSAIRECDLILMLRDGRRVDFGPRDRVLAGHLHNAAEMMSGAVASAGTA